MSEIETNGSWDKAGFHVLTEIDRLSSVITELIRVIGTLTAQTNKHESWRYEHERNQSALQEMVGKQGNDISTLKRSRDVLYGIVLTISVLIGSGLVVYFIQR